MYNFEHDLTKNKKRLRHCSSRLVSKAVILIVFNYDKRIVNKSRESITEVMICEENTNHREVGLRRGNKTGRSESKDRKMSQDIKKTTCTQIGGDRKTSK